MLELSPHNVPKFGVKNIWMTMKCLKLTIVVYLRDLGGHLQDLNITLHGHIELENKVQLE